MDIEKEIEESKKRIEKRQSQIETNLTKLDKKIKVYSNWAWFFVIIGLVIVIISTFYFNQKTSNKEFELNLLGDFLSGSVASIWSLAGLFFIYVAFLGQKQQLLNQQLEIMYSQLEVKYTRLELAGQKTEMKLQNETLKQQKFENTFFQLLNLLNSIVNSLDLREDNIKRSMISEGRDCFETFYKEFQNFTFNKFSRLTDWEDLESTTIREAKFGYNLLYNAYKSDLSHYYRTLYHVIKFIDRSKIENKKQYIAITRAQLSSYEQVLLFYNCIHYNGEEKFKPLIEKYTLFKNLDRSLILNLEHLNEYKNSAYEK